MKKQHFPRIDTVYTAITDYNLADATIPRPGRNERRVICPVHLENNPSCDLDLDRGYWICRACNAGGDAIDMVIKSGAVKGHNDKQIYARAFAYLQSLDGKTIIGTKPLPKPRFYRTDGGLDIIEIGREYYPYLDANREELFQVIRIDGVTIDTGEKDKVFRQRRRLPPGKWFREHNTWKYLDPHGEPVPYGPADPTPITRTAVITDENGRHELPEPSAQWLYTIRGLYRPLFNLPEVARVARTGGDLHLVEGERKARNLARRTGWTVTKVLGGAKASMDEDDRAKNLEYVRGVKRLFIWRDSDPVGGEGAILRAQDFATVIPEIYIVDVFGDGSKRDTDDWLLERPNARNSEIRRELESITARTPPFLVTAA